MNGAQLIAEVLRREGTDFLACYPRSPLINACAEIDIRPILCRQERVGVGMADGYTRLHRGRKNGVFAVQPGAGIENAFPGVAQAFSENVPILIIPGGPSLSDQYSSPVFRAAEVFKPVTKWSAVAHFVDELPHLLRRAYHAMRSGKTGPVLLEIADEVWTSPFEGELDYQPVPCVRGGPDPAAIRKAAEMLLAAENPLIWAGQGVLYAGASDRLVALAELLPAPVATTNPGKSAMPENHPLALGASTRSRPKAYTEFMRRADLVFAVGSSLSKTVFGPRMPPGKTVIHSTNDAVDINKDYAANLAVVGDAELVLEALIEEIGRRRKGATPGRTALEGEIAAVRAEWRREWDPFLNSEEVPLNQYRVIRDLMNTVDLDNVVITHDSGSPREQLLPFWEARKPGSYLGWGKSTQLGHGLGLIMGAKLAVPDKLCINVMGDSAIGMTGLDLETAARGGIGTLTVVFNNGAMATERDVLLTATAKYGALTVGGDYTKVAEGLGVAARRVVLPEEIVPAILEAIEVTRTGRPFLLEFVVKEGYDFSRYHLDGL